ncbi:hypothetical protein [Leptospira ryugenii]|uniref:hypothetical protein n=1 Tax=Leptospira ryugenii TaxID=1917863 RepID=UPI001435678F|nr:hypothetical protein [Leptospira ryugenii]
MDPFHYFLLCHLSQAKGKIGDAMKMSPMTDKDQKAGKPIDSVRDTIGAFPKN